MNFELGWRDVGITLFAIAQHFSLFTFHFSLPEGTALRFQRDRFSLCTFHYSHPEGTTIHFPKGPLFTPRREQAGLVFQDR